jgi:cation-transporting P-type ATPase E
MADLTVRQTDNKNKLGLSQEQVAKQIALGNVNLQPDPSAKSTKDIVKENVFTYFNLIFLILAILCIIAGSFNSLSFVPIIVANTLIGIVQELHAKKVLDDLSLLNQPTALVIRDGVEKEVATTELVLGDIILLKSGNQIPADAVVVKGEVSVNEALLTGEADEIEKKEKSELMSGSFVVSGECYARLTKVGADSYVSQLLLTAKKEKSGEQSEMIRSINRLVIAAGIIIIPVGIALFYQGYFMQEQSFKETVSSMVAALIGMIPEGMYLLVSVALAVSAALLAKKKVMLHDMKSTETLARVDVLCVDKTGTVTDNSMLVADVVPVGELRKEDNEKYRLLLQKYIWAIPDDNLTMQALRDYMPSLGKENCKAFIPFSSKYKYGSVTFDEDGQFLLGAPEAVLGMQYDLYKNKIEEYAGKGLRVMVFAKYAGQAPLEEGTKLMPQQRCKPLYFILLQNPLRENAVKVFSYFAEQGVKVKVISGDHALTVSEVARQAHIPDADKYVDATTLKTDDDIMRAAVKYTVFGRTTPEQKQKLIRALKQHGHTVAMTGDGVNDILAMKSADCSVAMAAGSDAAAQAAQVVLLDSDFAHMPQIVSEGRKTINNLQRSATLFLVKNIFSLLLAVFSIINVATYPLVASQITLISLFNIGIPAFFLAAEPNDQPIKGKFFTTVVLKSMPAALTNFLVIAALMVFGMTFNVSQSDISVAATFLMAIVGFMILYKLSQPMNKFHWGILIGCILGFLFCAYYFHSLFSISHVSIECVMLFVLFAIATEPLMRYFTKLFEFFGKFLGREHKLTKKRESNAA